MLGRGDIAAFVGPGARLVPPDAAREARRPDERSSAKSPGRFPFHFAFRQASDERLEAGLGRTPGNSDDPVIGLVRRLAPPLADVLFAGAGRRGRPVRPERHDYGAGWRASAERLFGLRVTDEGFVIDAVSRGFEEFTGLRQSRQRGRLVEQVMPPAIGSLLLARCRHCLSVSAPTLHVESLPLAGGQRHCEVTLKPVRGADGTVQLIVGSLREVSEDVETQMVLAASTGRVNAAALAPTIRFTVWPDGRPDQQSAQFFAYTGLPRDATAEQVLGCLHPEDVTRLAALEGLHEDCTAEIDARLRRHDGAYRWFRAKAELVDGLAGRRWYGVAVDIQDLHDIGEQARPAAAAAPVPAPLAVSGDRCFTIDLGWRITSVTPGAAEWVGVRECELLGADLRDRFTVPQPVIEAVAASLVTGRASQVEVPSSIYPGRWIGCQIEPFATGASIMFWDVTEEVAADGYARVMGAVRPETSPEAAEELLRGLVDAVTSGVFLLDELGEVVALNAAARAALPIHAGRTGRLGVGSRFIDVCGRLIPDLEEAALLRGMADLVAGRSKSFAHAYVASTPAGLRWRQMRITPFRVGEATRFLAVHEDLTEVAHAQAALRETSEQLLSAQEEERQRIAIELHDSTSQHLVVLGLGVAKLRRLLGDGEGTNELLEDMAKSVREAVKEIRVLSYLMKPAGLHRDGLEVTVRSFVKGFGIRTGLITSFRSEGQVDAVSDEVKHTVFRIVQEALSNVYRHAGARGAEVELANRGGVLVVRIADDGKGFSPAATDAEDSHLGVGIPGMRARAIQLGGTLDISCDGVGTVLTASIPPVAVTEFASHPVRGPRPR